MVNTRIRNQKKNDNKKIVSFNFLCLFENWTLGTHENRRWTRVKGNTKQNRMLANRHDILYPGYECLYYTYNDPRPFELLLCDTSNKGKNRSSSRDLSDSTVPFYTTIDFLCVVLQHASVSDDEEKKQKQKGKQLSKEPASFMFDLGYSLRRTKQKVWKSLSSFCFLG